jgi:hypothetical protein
MKESSVFILPNFTSRLSEHLYSNESKVGAGTAIDSPINQNPSITIATPVKINRFFVFHQFLESNQQWPPHN